MGDLVLLQAETLEVAAATAFVVDGTAGGTAIFLGTTRSQSNAGGQKLLALDYEAYDEMTRKQFADLAARARGRWPIVKLVILHRVGRVAVGEPSVLIAVSTPHRADAFEACRWIIDTLKAEAAIWKKEVWADGSANWLE